MIDGSIDVRRIRRGEIRWCVLQTLNCARPIGATENMLSSVLTEVQDNVTPLEIRCELDYLEGRKLIEVEKSEIVQQWRAKLTPVGVDVCEYTVDCPKGIARPKKYW